NKDGTLWWGIGAGLLFGIEFLLLYWGLLYTNASRAVIFLYVSPFVVAFGSHLFVPGGYLRTVQFAGLGCAFLGIIIAFQDSINLPTAQMLTGDLMIIGAAVAWGATTVLIKASPLIKIASSKILLYQLATSAVILPIGAILMGEPGVTSISPLIVFCLLYQVLWIASITYMIWFWLIQHYPVSNLSSFTFLTPLFGVIGGSVLLGEAITSSLIIALLLVGTGIYLVNKPKA
ncbi:MAG: DMT family transporter, partial [Proteobacteria bacterium]|nr:DMT family transporter [Pseudomonadota bacterium]